MVALIVFFVTVSGVIRSYFYSKRVSGKAHGQIMDDLRAEIDGQIEDRFRNLEKRMANIETIVLEEEKHRQFEKSL
jgi:hypothetical protein